MSAYLTIKSLHIVFMVSWFAGLFYLVRLFVYAAEAQNKPEPERTIITQQLLKMQKKLLNIITIPAMLITIIMGIWMLFYAQHLLLQSWMITKIIFVFFLILYQWHVFSIYQKQQNQNFKHSSFFLRIYNEVATILLIAIVFLAVFKASTNYTRYFSVLIFFILIISVFFYIYNKRNQSS